MEFNHKGHCLFYQTQLPLCVYLFRHECIKVFNIHHPSSNCHSHHQHNMDSCMNVASVQKILYGAAGGSRTLTRFNRRNFEFRAYEPFRHCGINVIGPPSSIRTCNTRGLSSITLPVGVLEALLGRSEKIRTFNTHGLNVRPLPIGIRFHHLSFTQSHFQNLVRQLRVERKSLESQSSILAVVLLRGYLNQFLYSICSIYRWWAQLGSH